jgi:hypothetical protein
MLFAHMKQHFRFTRLKLRGLAGAAQEFSTGGNHPEPGPPDPAAAAPYPETVRSSDVLKDLSRLVPQEGKTTCPIS